MTSAATTETRTQYGIRKPNGEIAWAAIDGSGRYLDISIEGTVKGARAYNGRRNQYENDSRAAMAAAMRAKAQKVGIPAEDFVNGHAYVTRDVITITMEPVIAPAPPVEMPF